MSEFVTSYVSMPQCVKCLEYEPNYEYVSTGDGDRLAEALRLECRRCRFTWLMACAPDPPNNPLY